MSSHTQSQAETPVQRPYRLTAAWNHNTAYHPSVFLLCALIFWSGIGFISEIMIPLAAIVFSIFTYAPTLYFAAQALVRWFALGIESQDAQLQAAHKVKWLSVSWVANAVIHIGLWWISRKDVFAEIFSLATGSQGILIAVFIAVRYWVDIRMTRKERNLATLRGDEESAIAESTAHLRSGEAVNDVPPRQEDEPTQSGTTAAPLAPETLLYQPSIYLLLVSISLSFYSMILEAQGYSHVTLTNFPPIQANLPTIVLHTYLIYHIMHNDSAQTLEYHATTIAGLSFDLIPLWLGTRVLMLYIYFTGEYAVLVPLLKMIPGNVEVLLVAYFAVRYTRGVYAERKRVIGGGLMEDDSPTPIYNHEAPSSSAQSTLSTLEPPTALYQPSIYIIAASIILTTTCIITESLAEPICGISMTITVYAPTTAVHLHLIYQQYQQRHSGSFNATSSTTAPTQSLQAFNKSMERSIQLSIIWILTQAFYLVVWPVNNYFKAKVMNPWVRWPEVLLVFYVAARYFWDQHARRSGGSIRLAEDPVEEMDAPATGAPSDTQAQ